MKEVKCKLYKYDELSKEVRDEMIEKKAFDIGYDVMDAYGDEYQATLEAFADKMGIQVYDWQVDYNSYYFHFRFKSDAPILGDWNGKVLYEDDVCGKYLRRWLNNNFMWTALPMKKYINYDAGYDRERRRWNKQRTSRIFEESWDNCPLTGVCYDYEVMKPVVDCLSKPIPDNYSLHDLIEDVLDNFFSAWQKEYEYWCDNTDNCIDEELSNRYEGDLFYEDGTEFNGIYEEGA